MMESRITTWTTTAAVGATMVLGAAVPALAGQYDTDGTPHHGRSNNTHNGGHSNWIGQHNQTINADSNSARLHRTASRHRTRQHHAYTGYTGSHGYNGSGSNSNWHSRNNRNNSGNNWRNRNNGGSIRTHHDRDGQNTVRRDRNDNGQR